MRARRPNPWTTVGVPLIIAFAGILGSGVAAYYGASAQNRAQDVRMVEIALSILKGDSTDEKGRPARHFAIETLKRYSGLTAEQVDWSTWANSGTVPFEDVSPWSRYSNPLLGDPNLWRQGTPGILPTTQP